MARIAVELGGGAVEVQPGRLARPMPCSALMLPPRRRRAGSTASSTGSSSGSGPSTFTWRLPSPRWPNRWTSGTRRQRRRRPPPRTRPASAGGSVTSSLCGDAGWLIASVTRSRRSPEALRGRRARPPTATVADVAGPRAAPARASGRPVCRRPRRAGRRRRRGRRPAGDVERRGHEAQPASRPRSTASMRVGEAGAPPRPVATASAASAAARPATDDRLGHRGDQPEPHRGHDGERALAPGQEAGQVVAGVVLHQAVEVAHDAAVGQHGLDAQHLGRMRAPPHDVEPAGVGGHHPADGGRVAGAEVDAEGPTSGRGGGWRSASVTPAPAVT